MSLEHWLTFVALACVAVLTPGPAVLLAVSHGSRFGARRAVFPILGNVTGLAIVVTASAVGVGSILEASSHWVWVLRVVGGLYLIYLGVRLWRSRATVDATGDAVGNAAGAQTPFAVPPSRRKSYAQGVAVALSNPKAILFIGALFPQFLDMAHPVWEQLAIMGATMMTLSFSILMLYAALSRSLAAKGRSALSGKINKFTGALFIAFGLALASGSR